MGLLTQTRQLLLYTLWADRLILDAAREMPPEALTRDAGVSFGSLLGTLRHILGSQRRWLARFTGLGRAPGSADFPDLERWPPAGPRPPPQLEFFLASLTEDQLAAEITWDGHRDRPGHPAALAAGLPHGEPLDLSPRAGGLADAPARLPAAEDGSDRASF